MVINMWLIYWISVLAGIKGTLVVSIIGFAIFYAICGAFCVAELGFGETVDPIIKVAKKTVVWFIICITLANIIPSKDTMYKMLVANVVTYDNLEIAKESGEQLINYLTDEIKEIIEVSKEE